MRVMGERYSLWTCKLSMSHSQVHPKLILRRSSDNAKFASSGGDKQVFVWDVASGAITRRLQGHFGKINAVAFNKEATVLCTAGFDAKIMIWDMRCVSPFIPPGALH